MLVRTKWILQLQFDWVWQLPFIQWGLLFENPRRKRAPCWRRSLPLEIFLPCNPGGFSNNWSHGHQHKEHQGTIRIMFERCDYSRPTFMWTSSASAKQRVVALGACIVDDWRQASIHVVDSFSKPGQRVSWQAKVCGHLILTKDLQNGPWIEWLSQWFKTLSEICFSMLVPVTERSGMTWWLVHLLETWGLSLTKVFACWPNPNTTELAGGCRVCPVASEHRWDLEMLHGGWVEAVWNLDLLS